MLQVRVAATSANLGPGFDALGIALDLTLIVRVQSAERDRFTYRGDGHVPDSPHNLVHQGFRAVYHELDLEPPRVAFEADNPIPLARGLGSSSAALVALKTRTGRILQFWQAPLTPTALLPMAAATPETAVPWLPGPVRSGLASLSL